MSTAEEVFDILSNKFITTMKKFRNASEDDSSWSVIDLRQQEILDANVDNKRKAEAFDYVLNEISRVHPRTNFAYCQALERRLIFTPAKDDVALQLISRLAYAHRGDESSDLFRKVITEAYQKAKTKTGFPNAKIARNYINDKKRELLEDDLRYIKYEIDDPYYDPVQKLNKVEEALHLLKEEAPLGRIQSNKSKRSFCEDAVKICREELHDENTGDKYALKAFDFKRRAANAERKWAKRRHLWTDAQEKAFLAEFSSKNER